MTNKKHEVFIFIILTIILIFFLINPDIIISSVKEGTIIFFDKVFISNFPFIILSTILINFNYHVFLSKIFGNFFSKIFNISKSSVIIIFLSLLSGHPGNAVYINNLYEKGDINKDEANKLLYYSLLPNPMFVIGSVGLIMLGSVKAGIIILVSVYITNFIIGIFMRDKIVINTTNTIYNFNNNFSIGKTLKESINTAISTSLIILGNITIFMILGNILFSYIDFGNIFNALISSLFEITNGLNKISMLDININLKIVLSIFTLNFSGLCIHSQVASILNFDSDYKKILVTKLIFSILSAFIAYILILLFNL